MRKRVTVGLLVFAVAAALFVSWQRYTSYGIFLAGGAQYWVQRAVLAPTDAEARSHLQRVVVSTQYGVNAAENAVRRLPRQADRVRMWRLLVETAPNDNWRDIYRNHLTQETVIARSAA